MNLYVLRHGKTNCNDEHKYNCRFDEDLNEEGIKQVIECKNKIKKLDIDLIICSPMKRAKHTCEIINTKNIPVLYDKRLMERIGGILTNTVIEEDYYKNEFYNYYSTNLVEGLEPLPVLFERVYSLLNEIKETFSDKNILLITHGAVAKSIQTYFESIPRNGNLLNTEEQHNCEIKKYIMP